MAQEFAERLKKIEQKWQKKWEEENLFQVDPKDEDKFFITVAYPYPSGGMHVGHVSTYTLPDVFARFKRMQGYNVLFPMAWHVTGTPIVGALERLKAGEEEQIETLRDTYGVPEEELEKWEEPIDYANYFIENSYKKNMKNLGFSVDWRREFRTSDNQYNKFIEWQYKRLQEQDLVKQGLHPINYCLNEENPVTTHDLLEGEDAEQQDYSLVKFESGDRVFPMATLRPETVFGVTHTLVNPDVTYIEALVDGEKWVLSEEAVEKLEHQEKDIKVRGEVSGEDLVGEKVRNPVTGDKVIMLPASFVDPDSGSGLVMSVPAHAPYDWISLKDIKEDEKKLREHGLDPEEVKSIEPIKIINIEDYDNMPAKEACENHGVESQEDEEALEKATEEVYEKEFHNGTLNSKCQDFAGEKVNTVKDRLKERFENQDRFDSMYDFSEEVRCRCGGDVIVSMEESWFLEYGDKGWKDKVLKNLNDMEIIPENAREQYEHTVDWLESWPCIRNYGLGTKLPFDQDFIIEPLSDSTIYMAYYTIRHIIEGVDAEKLEPEFFDYIFNNKGSATEIAESTGIDLEIVEKARESFDYWYPLDWRTSANELIQNHLTFFMFHHTALFNEDKWPEGIATWGMGLLEGEKMSSSKGHVIGADEALEKYGADTTRFFLFSSVEPWQDFDWRSEEVEDHREKLQTFYNRSIELYNSGESREKTYLDRYALSRLQEIIKDATEGLEDFQTRKAGLNAFFELNSLINKYRNRTETLNREVIKQLVEAQAKLMAPFTPHICEEIWDRTGHSTLISDEEWPEPDEELRDKEIERAHEFIEETVEDIREVSDIVDEFDEIKVILAEEWKRELFKEIKEKIEAREEFSKAMGELVEGREGQADLIKNFLQEHMDNPGDLPEKIFDTRREKEILEENREFISNRFNAEIVIQEEKNSEEKKASRAEPGKPAIVME